MLINAAVIYQAMRRQYQIFNPFAIYDLLRLLDEVAMPGACPLYEIRSGKQAYATLLPLRSVGEPSLVAVDERYEACSADFLRRANSIMCSGDGSAGAVTTHLAVGEEIYVGHQRMRRAFPVQRFRTI